MRDQANALQTVAGLLERLRSAAQPVSRLASITSRATPDANLLPGKVEPPFGGMWPNRQKSGSSHSVGLLRCVTKISRTRDHGANVVIAGDNLSQALEIAQATAEKERLIFVHPFDDPAVIAGQGTIAAEMLSAVPDLGTLVVPIGGGGLISGIAIAAKALRPDIRVIGVQSRTYPSMKVASTDHHRIVGFAG